MKQHFKRNWFWYLLTITLLVINGYYYLSRQKAIAEFEERLSEESMHWQAKLMETKQSILTSQLKLSTKTFSWALRESLIRKNFDQANQLIQQLVQEPSIQLVIYLDVKGKIVLASDKKLEGKMYNEFVSKSLVNAKNVTIHKEKEFYQVSAPIFSRTEKMGTVVIKYIEEGMQNLGPEVKTE